MTPVFAKTKNYPLKNPLKGICFYETILHVDYLSGVVRLPTVTTSNTPLTNESVVHIPLDKLYPPEFHPFHVRDDDAMAGLVKNIKANGVLVPAIVRSCDGLVF